MSIQFFDVMRMATRDTVDTYFDVKRKEAPKQETMFFDVRRVIPMSTPDYSSLSINIGAGMLSDSFQMSVPLGNAVIGDVIAGKFRWQEWDETAQEYVPKQWAYDFTISEITKRNGIAEYMGIYDNDKLMYTYYDYTFRVNQRTLPDRIGVAVRDIIEAICEQLGLTLEYHAMNWLFPLPKVLEEDAGGGYKRGYYSIRGTYNAVISELFGWLSALPNIQFTATIRDGKLYVTQRGYEQSSYTLQTVEFPPSVHLRRMRTEWAGSGNTNENNYTPDNTTQVPFTGEIVFGDCVIRYEEGLLMEETRGNATTIYTYITIDDETYLKVKETFDTSAESCAKTEYFYANIGDEVYLQREEVLSDGDYTDETADYSMATKTVTVHSPLGNGWYGTTVYEDGEEVSSTSLSQGLPGNSTTRYMVDATQDVLNNRHADREIVEALFRFLNPPCVSTSYPVMDETTIRALVSATDWLNNRIEETVTLTTVDAHIIDTTQSVVYNENSYVVESNSISHGVNGLRQSLTLKRWY